MLTTGEVAEKSNISIRRVRRLIEIGNLPSTEQGGDYLIKESEIKLVKDDKSGRPSKKQSTK